MVWDKTSSNPLDLSIFTRNCIIFMHFTTATSLEEGFENDYNYNYSETRFCIRKCQLNTSETENKTHFKNLKT